MNAIEFGHEKVIDALVECGAHIQMSPIELGEKLCSLARQGNLKKLNCYRLAGANLVIIQINFSTFSDSRLLP
jgi:hypothetical protein